MHWTDISELRDSASLYLTLLQRWVFGYHGLKDETVNRLHKAIDNINLDEVDKLLSGIDIHRHTITGEVENIVNIINGLIKEIGNNMPMIIEEIDPDATDVFEFCQRAKSVFESEQKKIYARIKTDPTPADEKAYSILKSYIDGKYSKMDLDEFMKEFIMQDVTLIARKRRLTYLIAKCPVGEIKQHLIYYLELCEKEIEVHKAKAHHTDKVQRKKPGRQVIPLRELIKSPNVEATLTKLHELIDGQSKDVAYKIINDFFNNSFLVEKPSWQSFNNEFPGIVDSEENWKFNVTRTKAKK